MKLTAMVTREVKVRAGGEKCSLSCLYFRSRFLPGRSKWVPICSLNYGRSIRLRPHGMTAYRSVDCFEACEKARLKLAMPLTAELLASDRDPLQGTERQR